MYELTCPTLDRVVRLDGDRVLSGHRVRSGRVLYLRCTCGATVMWSSSGTTLHPRSSMSGCEARRPSGPRRHLTRSVATSPE